jgi:IclR family pca regulon transcriptional regulator
MTKLVNEVKENCSAATLDGPYAVYVVRIRSDERIVDVSRTVGSRIPAYCTSLGRVLLAAEPTSVQEKLLNELPKVALTPLTVTDNQALMEILAEVKLQGWALVEEELEVGLCSLAVPVHDRRGQVVAALNISVQAICGVRLPPMSPLPSIGPQCTKRCSANLLP